MTHVAQPLHADTGGKELPASKTQVKAGTARCCERKSREMAELTYCDVRGENDGLIVTCVTSCCVAPSDDVISCAFKRACTKSSRSHVTLLQLKSLILQVVEQDVNGA